MSDVYVTDHAVLRWLERVERLDIEGLRARLTQSAAIGVHHGASAVLLGSGRLVLRQATVVTVLHRLQVPTDHFAIDLGDIAASLRGGRR